MKLHISFKNKLEIMNGTESIVITQFNSFDFIGSIFGTLVGAFVGFSLGVYWDRKKKLGEDKKTKLNACNGIIPELNKNLSVMNDMESLISNKVLREYKPNEITNLVFKGMISSKLFFTLDEKIQTNLLELYRNIEMVKEQYTYLLMLMSNSYSLSDSQLKNLQNTTGSFTIEEIHMLMKRVKDLTPNVIKDIETYKSSLEK